MGADSQFTTAPGTGRRTSLPRGFSLCLSHLPPLLCQLPNPHPSRSRQQVPGCSSPKRLPRHTVAHTCSQQRPSSQSCVLVVRSVRGGWERFFLATGTSRSLLESPIAYIMPFISLLSQLLQAGMPRQFPPPPEPLSTASTSSTSLTTPKAAPACLHL